MPAPLFVLSTVLATSVALTVPMELCIAFKSSVDLCTSTLRKRSLPLRLESFTLSTSFGRQMPLAVDLIRMYVMHNANQTVSTMRIQSGRWSIVNGPPGRSAVMSDIANAESCAEPSAAQLVLAGPEKARV